MTLKKYLQDNLQKFIEEKATRIRIADEDFMQGVDLLTDLPEITPDQIINDRPVKRFWDYDVTEAFRDEEGMIYISIKSPEPPAELPKANGYRFSWLAKSCRENGAQNPF